MKYTVSDKDGYHLSDFAKKMDTYSICVYGIVILGGINDETAQKDYNI